VSGARPAKKLATAVPAAPGVYEEIRNPSLIAVTASGTPLSGRRVRWRVLAYCLAMAMRRRSSGSMKWSWSSLPRSIWTQWILPLNRLSWAV
jgi:hypothetical protein